MRGIDLHAGRGGSCVFVMCAQEEARYASSDGSGYFAMSTRFSWPNFNLK
jgi:hypothetical protein